MPPPCVGHWLPEVPSSRTLGRYAIRGIEARQCYGTAELGLTAYETAGASDGMVTDEHVLVEIVGPGTGDPVAPGEVGEVLVTTFNPTSVDPFCNRRPFGGNARTVSLWAYLTALERLDGACRPDDEDPRDVHSSVAGSPYHQIA